MMLYQRISCSRLLHMLRTEIMPEENEFCTSSARINVLYRPILEKIHILLTS